MVLGCAWTVYANVFAASVYPTLGSTSFDAPVIRRPTALAARKPMPAVNNVVAALPEPAPVIAAPATVPPGPSLSFDDRFAAASPQGGEWGQAEAPKLAEVLKAKEASPRSAPVRVAAIAPAPHPAEVRPAKTP